MRPLHKLLAAVWIFLSSPHSSITQPDRRRDARLMIKFLFGIMLVIPFATLFNNLAFTGEDQSNHVFFLAHFYLLFVILPVYVLARSRYYRLAAGLNIALLMLTIFVLVVVLQTPGEERLLIYGLMTQLIASVYFGLLFNASVLLINLILLLILPIIGIPVDAQNYQVTFFNILALGLIITLLAHHRNQVERDRRKALESLNQELQQKNEALQMGRARDEAIMTSMADGLFAISPDGLIILINKQCLQWLEEVEDNVLGSPFAKWAHFSEEVNHRPILDKENIHQMLQSGQPIVYYQAEMHTHLDKTLPVSISAAPISKDGNNIGIVVSLTDRSQAKALDEAKNNFIGTAGHELRTPFTAVRGVVDMLTEGQDKLPPEMQQLLEMATEASDRMKDVIHKLIRMTEVQAGDIDSVPERCNVETLIDYIVETHTPEAQKKGLSLEADSTADLPALFVSKPLLGEIVSELVNNAVRFTAQGKITLRATLGKPGDIVAFRGKEIDLANQVVLEVQDTGKGINKEDMTKIYSSFSQEGGFMKRQHEAGGMGMGLYIIKQIAERIGVELWFSSTKGKGSRFFVSIPITKEQ